MNCSMCNDWKFTALDRSLIVRNGKNLSRYMDCPACVGTHNTWLREIPKGKTFLDYNDTLPVDEEIND